MRCPKCGYISFDNVDKCLKCRKNIAGASKELQGSVLNVATPVFLKIGVDEEEVEAAVDGLEESIEFEEDFEVVDPDLDILVDEEEDGAGDIQLDLEGDAADEDEIPDLDELSGELSEIEAFTEDDDEAVADEDVAIDLGMFEETAEAEPESDVPAMDVPEELADLSDLSPPEKFAADTEEPEASEDDIEFAGLEVFESDESPAAAPDEPPELKKETVLSLDMDEDLDFELDLGGLSIHDDKK